MARPLTKTQLVAALAEEMGSDKKSAAAALDGIIAVISREVSGGGAVTLPGVGKIYCRERPARMVRNPATVDALDTMEACLQKGQELKVGQFPVMEDGEVVGLISASEIFALAAHFLGAFERRSGVTLGPMAIEPGTIGRVTDLVEGSGAEVVALYPINAERPPSSLKKLIVRFHGPTPAVSAALEAAGYAVIESVENAKACTRAAA